MFLPKTKASFSQARVRCMPNLCLQLALHIPPLHRPSHKPGGVPSSPFGLLKPFMLPIRGGMYHWESNWDKTGIERGGEVWASVSECWGVLVRMPG